MSYGNWKPYVPVAERRKKAAAKVQQAKKSGQQLEPIVLAKQTIAATFWGKAWCHHLETYSDFENRLPRGRSYVRNGSVIDLKIEPGKVLAQVMGSRLYRTAIAITPLPAAPPAPATPVRLSVAGWLGAELLDLFPWRHRLEKRDILLNSIGLLLALLTSWAWLLGAAGRLEHLPILSWWLVWSLYEIAARMQTKPVVREGAWWHRHFRPASWADMAAYVSIKNILLASLLFFIISHDPGLGTLLQWLPDMLGSNEVPAS